MRFIPFGRTPKSRQGGRIRQGIASIRTMLPSLVLRATVLWILARAIFTAFNRASANILPGLEPPPPGLAGTLAVPPATALALAAAVSLLVLSDVRAVRERAFLANLGVGPGAVATVAFSVAIVLEAGLAIVIGP